MSSKENTAAVVALPTTPQTGEQVLQVALSDIHVDYAWNCRSERRVQDMADTENGGFEGFAAGIRANGQISPVILRNTTGGKTLSGQKTDKRYELVVGFRRFRALTLLNSKGELERAKNENRPQVVPNVPNGTILALVKDVPNKTAARVLNGVENTGRSNLKAPDMVFLVKELQGDGLTQTAIAEALSITQGWVSKLALIGTLPPAVLANWRDGTPIAAVTVKDGTFRIEKGQAQKEMTEPDMRAMAALKCSPEEITARYIRLVTPQPERDDGPGTGGEKDKVKEEVRTIASLMGCMVRVGVLENGSLDWLRVIGPRKKGFPIDCGKDDSQSRLLELGDTASEAFEIEVTKGARGKVGEESS